MEWYQAAFDRMYPILYHHRDFDEAARVIDTYERHIQGKSPVLDLASGSGRYTEALTSRGYTAFGLDLSHYLLRTSVEHWGHAGVLVQGDMRRLPFADESIGAVLNMFTSFGYFSRDTDNLLVFKEVYRVLQPGGVLLFDYLNAERISSDLLEHSRRESGGYLITEHRKIEGRGKYLVKNALITKPGGEFRQEIEERLRLYTREELVIMFKSVGLTVQDIYGDYAGNPFVEGVSERVVVVSVRPAS